MSKKASEFYNKIFKKEGLPFTGDIPADSHKWIKKEMNRLRELYDMEKSAIESGVRYIAGVDEVGRGPMAGPLTACAVVFDAFKFIPALNDSKKINHNLRELISRAVKDCALSYSVSMICAREIDRLNIHNAALEGMTRAIEGLSVKPGLILVDGRFTIPGIEIPQKSVIKGDAKVFSIAAASIVAKVTRDREMCRYDNEFPGYGFSSHKGYCTKEHTTALKKLGACPIHRRSYKPVRDLESTTEQLTLI